MPVEGLRSRERRVAAIFLPQIWTEVARQRSPLVSRDRAPVAVVSAADGALDEPQLSLFPSSRLIAVNPAAQRLGVRAQQTVAEAKSYSPSLRIVQVQSEAPRKALLTVADVASSLGGTVAVPPATASPDTVWLDVTGSAARWGGEDALADEIQERVRLLGHAVRVVIASGPELARAIARMGEFGASGVRIVPTALTAHAWTELPLRALPLESQVLARLAQWGLLTIEQLLELPRPTLEDLLGGSTSTILELVRGQEHAQLEPLLPPRILEEGVHWEEPVESFDALSVVLRGLLARLSARLESRGEAARRFEIQLQTVEPGRRTTSTHKQRFELPSPLGRESEWERLLRTQFSRRHLPSGFVGLQLRVSQLSRASIRQLSLVQEEKTEDRREREVQLLLQELSTELGREKVGVLEKVEHLRPEGKSRLLSWEQLREEHLWHAGASVGAPEDLERMTRGLPTPVALSVVLREGSQFALGAQLYTLEKLRVSQRVEDTERWSPQPIQRDYYWASLQSTGLPGRSGLGHGQMSQGGRVEALFYVDRHTGRTYLQGWVD